MGSSSNGVSRGQLRPHFAGRGPPFIVAGLMVICCLLAFSYWNLSSRHSVLEAQLSDTQVRNQEATIKLQQVEKSRSELNTQFQDAKEELERIKQTVEKDQQQMNDLTQKLRGKEEELSKGTEETESLRSQLTKCSEDKDRKEKEVDELKGNIRTQIEQIQQLEETKEKMQNVINNFGKLPVAQDSNVPKGPLSNSISVNNIKKPTTSVVLQPPKIEEVEPAEDPNVQIPQANLPNGQ